MNIKLKEELAAALRTEYQCGRLIRLVARLAEEEHQYDIRSRIERVSEDYRRMADFMGQGYSDPDRGRLYEQLSKEAVDTGLDLYKRLDMERRPSFLRAQTRLANVSFSYDYIRSMAEGFVTDVAMLSLESGEGREQKQDEIYTAHQRSMSLLFDHILVSANWTAADSQFYTGLILSPTIDVIDAQTIVSAIGLSASQYFDMQKAATLAEVYLRADDERVRQKALVGFVFALDDSIKVYLEEQKEMCQRVCATDKNVQELYELQRQLYFTNNTEADSRRVQDEIMGDLMRNPNLKITRFGIEENDDPMTDILHPDASEKAMDDVERAMKKLSDMQKQGADIYFGGFSHMKRYPFFYDLSNWFVPFYLEHPGIRQACSKLRKLAVMRALLEKGSFCDSDKYSLTLALSTTIDMMPDNVKEMLNSPDVSFADIPETNIASPAYIRRMYLQDFYRFFNVYSDKGDYRNVLKDGGYATSNFMYSPLFEGTRLYEHVLEMVSFLKKNFSPGLRLLLNYALIYPHKDDPKYLITMGFLALAADSDRCLGYFKKVLAGDPANEQAMKGLARAELIHGDAAEAATLYDHLSLIHPERKVFVINRALALVKAGDCDKALNLLYKLNLDDAGDDNVNRALAWALLNKGDSKGAYDIYLRLMEKDAGGSDDVLNMGYAAWACGRVKEAASLFKHYCLMIRKKNGSAAALRQAFEDDERIFEVYNIGVADRALMIEMSVKE